MMLMKQHQPEQPAEAGRKRERLRYVSANLTRRKDVRQNLTEIFTYDSLDRLTGSTLNSSPNLTITYDAVGNITNKSDVGSYTYHATKKHAVT
jgi:YD repeat-containing protein